MTQCVKIMVVVLVFILMTGLSNRVRAASQVKLIAADGAVGNNFGWSVAISGDTAIVGAPFSGVEFAGSAYVFTRTGSTWTQQAKLSASDAAIGDNLGWSVAISGDTALAGAPFDDDVAGADQGSANIFAICTKDLTGDDMIDGADLGILIGNWGSPGITDLNGDGTTDGADLGLLLGSWGLCP